MTTTIQKARGEDAIEIAELLRGLEVFAHLSDETPEATGLRIQEHLQLCLADASHTVLISRDASKRLTGYLSVHWLPYFILKAPEGFVSELFVDNASRGQGVGKRLLDVAKTEAEARGCSRLSLLNFRNGESYQRQFYAKNGWQERTDAANFVFPISTGN